MRAGARHQRRRAALRVPQPAQVANTAWWCHTWLHAPGSLTARLRHLGKVQVHVLTQGTRPLWPAEQSDLQCRHGHVREVILTVNDTPMVWARSTTSHLGLKGPWKSLRGLGNRALAELLFSHTQVRRGALRVHAWRKHSLGHARASRQWLRFCLAHAGTTGHTVVAPPPWHARASVFWHKGQPLRVMEAFNPVLACWGHPV